jgi:hypothetical protein
MLQNILNMFLFSMPKPIYSSSSGYSVTLPLAPSVGGHQTRISTLVEKEMRHGNLGYQHLMLTSLFTFKATIKNLTPKTTLCYVVLG